MSFKNISFVSPEKFKAANLPPSTKMKKEVVGSKTPLEELREAIKNSQEAIASEFARTENTWLACFGSRIFQVETFLNTKTIKNALPRENLDLAGKKLERLKIKVQKLIADYPTKEKSPPEDIRQELLKELTEIL